MSRSLKDRIKPNARDTVYEKVLAARKKGRATAVDFIRELFTDFIELHGDRRYGDDSAIVAGIAYLDNMPVTVIGIEKGHELRDKTKRNFGSAHPEGYRKALRQMKLAEKFGRPVICIVDTSGAYCGVGAEERGQGQAIAENLMAMMALRTPVISVLIGEGGSGGALALAVADRVWMLENAIYSVISPEGCASILWKDSSKIKEASVCLKLTAQHMLDMKIVERTIPEDDAMFACLRQALIEEFQLLKQQQTHDLLDKRYARFRKLGEFI